MAKKVVAGMKKATGVVKVIRPVKKQANGTYRFKEDLISKDDLNTFLKNNA